MRSVTKVRMLVGLSGPAKFYDVGDLYECGEAEAARLIGARYAVPWIDEIERAVKQPIVETRTKARRKK